MCTSQAQRTPRPSPSLLCLCQPVTPLALWASYGPTSAYLLVNQDRGVPAYLLQPCSPVDLARHPRALEAEGALQGVLRLSLEPPLAHRVRQLLRALSPVDPLRLRGQVVLAQVVQKKLRLRQPSVAALPVVCVRQDRCAGPCRALARLLAPDPQVWKLLS